MKKIVAILLSTLPFILIYLISITGKIVSKYVHIPVERIAILNPFGDELNDDDLLKINKDEPTPLDIKVFPSLATDKTLEFSFSDKENISIDENYNVTAKEYGIYNIIAISKDNYKVYKEINIKVSQDDIESIEIPEDEQNITLDVGEFKEINAIIHSKETLPENRKLVWSSENLEVASVDQNGKIVGRGEGTTKINVCSSYKPNVNASINVTVVKVPVENKPIYFDVEGNTYITKEEIFDLSSITKINVQYSDLLYEVTANLSAVDASYLNYSFLKDSTIRFIKENVRVKIKVSIRSGDEIYSDVIYIKFQK